MSKLMNLGISGIHHVALITSDYERSKDFYTRILGFKVIRETYRAHRDSYKLDLSIPNSSSQLELFSFPNRPERPSPEAKGWRHLALAVSDIDASVKYLIDHGVAVEDIRVDELTGMRFTFIQDPDNCPIEFYEIKHS